MNADRFTVEGLRASVADSIDLLATSAGLFSKALLPRDPRRRVHATAGRHGSSPRPQLADGVWASRDGERALLLARTRAEGADTDGQSAAVAAIRAAFGKTSQSDMRLALTGPGPFSVTARATIKDQVLRLSGLGSLIIIGLLLLVYRSPRAVLLGLLPVLSGALAGVAAVSLGFGVVHGVTLGFGTALIGEAVDYSIYLLTQSEWTKGSGATTVTRCEALGCCLLANGSDRRADLRIRLCLVALFQLPRPCPTGPVCHRRPCHRRPGHPLRPAYPLAPRPPCARCQCLRPQPAGLG